MAARAIVTSRIMCCVERGIEMSIYYEINVARGGNHYFATAPRSITSNEQARRVYSDFIVRFPVNEGFRVTVTKWENVGTNMQWGDSHVLR
jgi:hypothetical protein